MPKTLDAMSPEDHVDYYIEWETWLEGDTVVTSSWTANDPSIEIESDIIQNDTRCIVWLTGGTVNRDYVLENEIITAAGREFRSSIIVPVRDT